MEKKSKGRKLKCPVCSSMNYKEDAVLIGKRHFCKGECEQQELERLEKSKLEQDDWSELYNYIEELYGEKPTGMMFKQLGEFRKDPYNYTNKGMYLTLKYFYETKQQSVINNTGLGIIPYVYEEAKKNYIEQMQISAYNSEFESKEEVKTVKINRRQNRSKDRLIQEISFDDLDQELEDDDGNE